MSKTKNSMRVIKLELNSSLKSYIGYLRKEYNSYELGEPSSTPSTLDIFGMTDTQTIDPKAIDNIASNIKFNDIKVKRNLTPLPSIYTKKSGNFHVDLIRGSTVVVQGSSAFIKLKQLIYRFEMIGANLKDGHYQKCSIGIQNNVPYIVMDTSKKNNGARYITKGFYTSKKVRKAKIEAVKFIRGLKIKKNPKDLVKNFVMNIIQFHKDLASVYPTSLKKTEIVSVHDKLEQLDSGCENQAAKIVSDLYNTIYNEYCIPELPMMYRSIIGKMLNQFN